MRALVGLAFVLAVAVSSTSLAYAVGTSEPATCKDGGDRFTKLQLAENLTTAPHIIVLGSSRARPAMPATLSALTGGGPVFNAGVREGSSADTYVFARLLDQKFPNSHPEYLIFVEAGIAIDAVNPELANEPLAKPFLVAPSTATSTCVDNHHYAADGGLTGSEPSLAQRLKKVAAGLPGALKAVPLDAKKPRYINPAKTTYFQKLLAFANAQGATPVVVLNPIYPKILAARNKYGWPLRTAANNYLAYLHQHYNFISLDAQDIRTWGGLASDFDNITHIDRTNMGKLLKWAVPHSNGHLLGHR